MPLPVRRIVRPASAQAQATVDEFGDPVVPRRPTPAQRNAVPAAPVRRVVVPSARVAPAPIQRPVPRQQEPEPLDEDEYAEDLEVQGQAAPTTVRRNNFPTADEVLETGGRSAKFEHPGDIVRGTVIKKDTGQQRDITTKKLKFWDDGNPMLHLVITLQTEEQEDDKDDGVRRVFAKIPGAMITAIRGAMKDVGARQMNPGDYLSIKYTKDGVPTQRGLNPPKEYKAVYRIGR